MMSPEQLLAALRRDSRTHITAMWRWLDDTSGAISGSGVLNCTLNEFVPYYAGWAPSLEYSESIIPITTVKLIEGSLTREDWGNSTLGGRIYRLKEAQ